MPSKKDKKPPRKRITQEVAERLKPGVDKAGNPKDKIEWDAGLKGFGLICRKNGETKTWIMQRDVAGKTARETLGHFPDMNASAAREKAEGLSGKMKGGFNPHDARAADLTLGVAFEKYLEVRVDIAESTRALYKDNFQRYVADFKANGTTKTLTDTPLYELGKNAVRVEEMFATVTRAFGKGAANQAAQIVRFVYKHQLKYHDQWPSHPVKFRLHKLKPRRKVIPYELYEQWARTVMSIENPVRRCGQLFILLSGMRVDATRKMRWEHINWERKSLLVPEPKGGELHEFTLPLSTQMVAILERLRIYSEEGWAFGDNEKCNQWCFPSFDSESGHVEEFKEQRRAACVNPHSLRRTFMTRAADMVPKKHISFLVNHAIEEENVTDDYIQAEDAPLRASQQKISDYIMSKLVVSLPDILGPVHSGTKQTFGILPEWGRKGKLLYKKRAGKSGLATVA
jgi:integrase